MDSMPYVSKRTQAPEQAAIAKAQCPPPAALLRRHAPPHPCRHRSLHIVLSAHQGAPPQVRRAWPQGRLPFIAQRIAVHRVDAAGLPAQRQRKRGVVEAGDDCGQELS